jgi:pentatricopeptide repeat protein
MDAKCGSMEDAWRVFNKLPMRDVVPWNAMTLAHGKCGQGWKALELFKQMQQEGVPLDSVTFLGVLSACASVLQLKHAGLLMNRPFKVVASQMPLWGMGSLTCMSNVEVWKYEGHFKSVQQFTFMRLSHLDYYA